MHRKAFVLVLLAVLTACLAYAAPAPPPAPPPPGYGPGGPKGALSPSGIAGTVVNAAGQPLAGVTVFNNGDGPVELKARTDAAGRFLLKGFVLTPGAFVFVEQPCYHFYGGYFSLGTKDAKIVLTPADGQRPAVTLQPQREDLEYRRELAQKLVDKGMALIKSDPKDPNYLLLAYAAIQLDPTKAPTLTSDPLKRRTLFLLIDRLSDLAPEEVIQSTSQYNRWTAMYYLLKWSRRPEVRKNPAVEAQMLQEVITFSRDDEPRVLQALTYRTEAAGRLLELGYPEARQVLDRDLPLVSKLPFSLDDYETARVVMVFAQAYYLVDPEKALALVKGPANSPYNLEDMTRQKLGVRRARKDPDEGLRVYPRRSANEPQQLSDIAMAAAIAETDPARAEAFAREIADAQVKALALGEVAAALIPTDRERARKLFGEAYQMMSAKSAGEQRGYFTPGLMLASLAVMMRDADPAMAYEAMMRGLSRRSPVGRNPNDEYMTSVLVQAAQKVDAPTARRLLRLPEDPSADQVMALTRDSWAYPGLAADVLLEASQAAGNEGLNASVYGQMTMQLLRDEAFQWTYFAGDWTQYLSDSYE
ncbi:MAG: carboxypeptidase-like regulatory domain-containing protein [Armatimonadia bacterium]